MAGQTIGGATLTTPLDADWVPLQRSGDTTPRKATINSLASNAQIYLANGAVAGATSLTVNVAPVGVSSNPNWVVIDPYTSQCEIRKVTAIAETELTIAALTYAHNASDGVFFVDSPTANVTWFGALGDATTDDTTAIQAAISAVTGLGGGTMGDGGGKVYLPRGDYLFSSLTIPSDIDFYGDGRDATILRKSAATGTAIAHSGAVVTSRACLHDFQLRYGAIGIDMEGFTSGRLYNLLLIGQTTGIDLDGGASLGCYGNVLENIRIDTCTTGVRLGALCNLNQLRYVTVLRFSSRGFTALGGGDTRTNLFLSCDAEIFTGDNAEGFSITGVGNTLMNCWVDADSSTGASPLYGVVLAGSQNMLINNYYSMGGSDIDVDYSLTDDNTIIEPTLGLFVIGSTSEIASIPLTDYSDTSTITGWSAFTSKRLYYKKLGKTATVYFYLAGTSNSTAVSFTLPTTLACNAAIDGECMIRVVDNSTGATAPGRATLAAGATTVNCYSTFTGVGWTASNNKYAIGTLIFETA